MVKAPPVPSSLTGTFLVSGGAARALAPAAEAPGRKKAGETSCTHSGKRASSECCAPVEDVPESSTGKSKKSRATPPETKKVPVKEDGTGGALTGSRRGV